MSKALVLFACGARGTGKTAWVKQQIQRAKPARLLIWDFKHDESLDGMGTDVRNISALIAAARSPRFALRYMVDYGRDVDAQFDLFCKLAWQVGNLLMFVDELPEVSKPGHPPPEWRKCINVGRSYKGADGKPRALSIIAAAQRPAECDKSIISNADLIHTGRLNNLDDARQMAKTLGCDFRALMNLPDLHWVEKEASKVVFSQGILKFSGAGRVGAKSPKG